MPCCQSGVYTARWVAVLTSANFHEFIILHHPQYPAVLPPFAGYEGDKIDYITFKPSVPKLKFKVHLTFFCSVLVSTQWNSMRVCSVIAPYTNKPT